MISNVKKNKKFQNVSKYLIFLIFISIIFFVFQSQFLRCLGMDDKYLKKTIMPYLNKEQSNMIGMLGSQANIYQLMYSEKKKFFEHLNVDKVKEFTDFEELNCGGEEYIIPNKNGVLKEIKYFGYPLNSIPVAKDDNIWLKAAKYLTPEGLSEDVKNYKLINENYIKSNHKCAIIIPFRVDKNDQNKERCNHLRLFIPYISEFLKNTPHRVFIINLDGGDDNWNRGYLLNIGVQLIPKHYDYFIFHDPDELPLNESSGYKFHEIPIHRGRYQSRMGYNSEQYAKSAFGAITQISRKVFEGVNGYSNAYWGWGGEDDDLFYRIQFRKRGKGEPAVIVPGLGFSMSFSLPHRRDSMVTEKGKSKLRENKEYLKNYRCKQKRSEGIINAGYKVISEYHSKLYSQYTVTFTLDKYSSRRIEKQYKDEVIHKNIGMKLCEKGFINF